jgi:hypothetical protein
MKEIYIYHHLGLGDHIICNAIVRIYAEKYNKIYLFVKPHNFDNVTYMYRDLLNVKFIQMDDTQVKSFMKFNPSNNYLIAGITPEYLRKLDLSKEYKTFDEGFYEMTKIPIEDKWNKFYFQRNIKKEKYAFYNILKLKDGEEYFFVHDDPLSGRHIKPSYITPGIKLIHPSEFKEVGIFDFIYTIENAKEVHCMDSSFSCMIDTMQIKTNKLFMHLYVVTYNSSHNPKFKLNWILIK